MGNCVVCCKIFGKNNSKKYNNPTLSPHKIGMLSTPNVVTHRLHVCPKEQLSTSQPTKKTRSEQPSEDVGKPPGKSLV